MPVPGDTRQVLICGAGPTGLVLALWLAKRQLPFRIIDKAPHAGTASRALVIQARTLEFYRMLGIDQTIAAHTRKVDQLRLWVKQRQVGTVFFGREANGISAWPFFYVYPQDEHEALLEAELRKLGICVQRNTELLAFEETGDGIVARLKLPAGGEETVSCSWLAGCDGSLSKVRETIGAAFPGGTYDPIYYVADIVASGPVVNGGLNLALDQNDFLAVFPMQGEGRVRLVGTIDSDQPDRKFEWDDVSQDILRRLDLRISNVNWFSTYRVHHRVASFFRKGRVFLCGDAAHVHSPVGGQGMNTGIGDAINLAWKLDAVLRQGAPEAILDTYEQERIPFAHSLVNTTDRVFTFVNKRSAFATAIRTRLVPLIMPLLFKRPAIRRAVFRLVSQTRIQYRKGSLSSGAVGRVHGGDRLPWLQQQDNYAALTTLDWQLHCYGPAPAALTNWSESNHFPLHVFTPSDLIKGDTLCLIRPDGYIGWIGHPDDLQALTRYAAKWGIIPSSLAPLRLLSGLPKDR
jgi:2-polyprenyl-6-methoxyphenol hydroxylase-like FAD-dependent oxidoreductase